jgi:hypothetical protein
MADINKLRNMAAFLAFLYNFIVKKGRKTAYFDRLEALICEID